MVKHEDRPTCLVCGCPLRPGDEMESRICDPCFDWQSETNTAASAVMHADRERDREQRERWTERRKSRRPE